MLLRLCCLANFPFTLPWLRTPLCPLPDCSILHSTGAFAAAVTRHSSVSLLFVVSNSVSGGHLPYARTNVGAVECCPANQRQQGASQPYVSARAFEKILPPLLHLIPIEATSPDDSA